ncbi:hypothetical protein HY992_01960 [Candidatus Micrarchaeota archaeon]|nr:hypothetical protein [Candidatus Micrarchaeota archaeon]
MKTMKTLAFLVFAFALAAASFQETHLEVLLDANIDGSSHVQETFRLFMTDKPATEVYDAMPSSANDIGAWRTRTNISDVRHHFDRSAVNIENIVIRPQPKDACSVFQGTCYGTVVMEYDVLPIYLNGTQLEGTGPFFTEKTKPRTTSYALNVKALSFETTQKGEVVIPANTKLTIRVPVDALVQVTPLPPDLKGKRTRIKASEVEGFSWSGQTTLAGFVFKFDREEPLSTEVVQFFQGIETQAKKLFYSIEGIALMLITVIAIVSYVLLKKK